MLYLGTSSGATLHFEYCMGRLIKVGLADNHIKKHFPCGMGKMAKNPKKCCNEKQQQLKTEKSSIQNTTQVPPAQSAILLALLHYFLPNDRFACLQAQSPVAQSPPLNKKVPVYLNYCTFRV